MPSRASAVLAAILFLVCGAATAQVQDDTALRLATIARVWGAVRYAHPSLFTAAAPDWDAAGAQAAERARGTEPLLTIVADMLGALGDPATRIGRQCVEEPGGAAPPKPSFTALPNNVIYVPLETLTGSALDAAAIAALSTARAAILDLRTPVGRCSTPVLSSLRAVEELLIAGRISPPARRRIAHDGYRAQDPTFDGLYRSFFTSEVFGPITGTRTGDTARTVFLVDEHTTLPLFAIAMVHSGHGTLLSSGPFHETAAVAHLRVPIEHGYEAVVRSAEITAPGRIVSIGAMTMSAGLSDERVIGVAHALTQPAGRGRALRFPSSASTREQLPYVWRRDATYPEMRYPSFGYRALAGFRLWNVIEYFYGYRHLLTDWNERLPQILTLLTSATSQREYELALARAMTFVPDGHSQVRADAFYDVRGRYTPAFALMPVEGKPVVVDLIEPAAAGPVQPGDELLAIDGRPIAERYAELEPYISASHELARQYAITLFLPFAATESSATYTFRKRDGSTYDARLYRGAYARTAPEQAWRILPGNIGYVDLRWLQPVDVNRMIDEMMGTRGLVIDLRNYPLGVFVRLARRLNTVGSGKVAQLRVPRVEGGHVTHPLELQDVGTEALPQYTAPTITLINERAISQSEHTGLVLEAVNRTTFVGSPTVGANGNISVMSMPGGSTIIFTGMDVRHLDGRQLQQVGIVPHVPVPRTIGALSAGRDEVLERAVALLSQ